MNSEPVILDPKDPAEIVPITFEFVDLTSTPSSPTIAIQRLSGADDPTPTAMLLGAPQVVGSQVRQKVQGGVNGAIYGLRCEVNDADANHWVIPAKLPVETA